MEVRLAGNQLEQELEARNVLQDLQRPEDYHLLRKRDEIFAGIHFQEIDGAGYEVGFNNVTVGDDYSLRGKLYLKRTAKEPFQSGGEIRVCYCVLINRPIKTEWKKITRTEFEFDDFLLTHPTFDDFVTYLNINLVFRKGKRISGEDATALFSGLYADAIKMREIAQQAVEYEQGGGGR